MAKPRAVFLRTCPISEVYTAVNLGECGYDVDVAEEDPRKHAIGGYCANCGERVFQRAYGLGDPRLVYAVHSTTACAFSVETGDEAKTREAAEWPTCASCGSPRIISVVMGDPRDEFCCECPHVEVEGEPLEYEGYMLHSIGIGEEFKYCLDCGRIVGAFPVTDEQIQESFDA